MRGNIHTLFLANLFLVLCSGHPQFGKENEQISVQLDDDYSNTDTTSPIKYTTSISEKGSLENTGTALKVVPMNQNNTPCTATGGPLGKQTYLWKEIVFRWIETAQGIKFYAIVIHISQSDESHSLLTIVEILVDDNGPDNDLMKCFLDELPNVKQAGSTFYGASFLLYIWTIPENDSQSSFKICNSSLEVQENPKISQSYHFKLQPKTPLKMSRNQFNRINDTKGYNGKNLGQGYPPISCDQPESLSPDNHYTVLITTTNEGIRDA